MSALFSGSGQFYLGEWKKGLIYSSVELFEWAYRYSYLDKNRIKDEIKTDLLKEDEKTKLMCLSGVKQYPMRVKCATLSWHTLTSAIDNFQNEINIENNEA